MIVFGWHLEINPEVLGYHIRDGDQIKVSYLKASFLTPTLSLFYYWDTINKNSIKYHITPASLAYIQKTFFLTNKSCWGYGDRRHSGTQLVKIWVCAASWKMAEIVFKKKNSLWSSKSHPAAYISKRYEHL